MPLGKLPHYRDKFVNSRGYSVLCLKNLTVDCNWKTIKAFGKLSERNLKRLRLNTFWGLATFGGGWGGGATFGGPLGRKSPTQAFDVTFGGRSLLWELYGISLYIKLFFS